MAGAATVPVAYLIATELTKPRSAVPLPSYLGQRNSGANWVGIVAAALVATNPMLVWYSQEARAYALFALLTSVALLYFVRALDGGRRRDFVRWGIASALALATHYFAVFPIAAEAVWLLRRRGRIAVAGMRIVVVAALLLAPLAIHQMSIGHAEWIGNFSLPERLGRTAVTFMAGETGDIIAEPLRPFLALVPLALVAAALALLAARGDTRERRAGGIVLAIAAATVAMPLALALVSPAKDYVLARNLMPALVPLLVAVAIAVTLRGARRAGAVLGIALVAYFARLLHLGERLAVPPAARLGHGRGQARRAGRPAGDRHLDAGRGIASLLPLDRLLSGLPGRRLRVAGPRGRLRLRRSGAAGPGPAARPRLPPGRLRTGRPAVCEALLAPRPRVGAAANAIRAERAARLPQQRRPAGRNRPRMTCVPPELFAAGYPDQIGESSEERA